MKRMQTDDNSEQLDLLMSSLNAIKKELGEARERKDRLTKQINSKTTERDEKNSEIAKTQIQKAKINKNKSRFKA